MSKYTTEVREICAFYSGIPSSSYTECIAASLPKIFTFNFPIFEESYRNVLQTKILKHFYMREIGCETVGAWKLALDDSLNNLMPYYNNMYKAASENINFTHTEYITEKIIVNGSAESNGKNLGQSIDTQSDTPQGSVQNLKEGKYLTNAAISNSENSTNARSNTQNTTENFIQGYRGYAPGDLLDKYYKALVNIDLKLLDNLEPLFMQLW